MKNLWMKIYNRFLVVENLLQQVMKIMQIDIDTVYHGLKRIVCLLFISITLMKKKLTL